MSRFGDALESAIRAISPRWGASREAWRRMRDELGAYRSSSRSRTDPAEGSRGTADWTLAMGTEREKMMFRARELERNNVLADAILTRSTENVVSTGIRVQAKTSSAEWNAKAEALFNAWADNACDVRGMSSLWEMQALTWRSYQRDGDVGTLLLEDGRIQSIEADQIADPPGKLGAPSFVDGVEVDVSGRPVRFHVVDERKRAYGPGTPDRRSLPDRIEIEADKVLFLSRRKRLGQTRGETIFAQSFWLFDQLDGNVEAVTMAARMAACFGLVIKRGAPYGGLPTTTGGNGESYRKWALEPAMVKELEAGDEISQIQPQQPTQNFGDFVALLSRLLGVPLGLPLELVLLDFSRTNYSSARAALLQAYRAFRVNQAFFISHWCRPLYRWRVQMWIESGDLPKIDGWEEHSWIPPGWAWVDPKAEVDAALAAVDAGFKTVHDVIAEQGRDFDEIVATRGAEIRAMKAAGIAEIRSVSTRDPVDPNAKVAKQKAKADQQARVDIERLKMEAAARAEQSSAEAEEMAKIDEVRAQMESRLAAQALESERALNAVRLEAQKSESARESKALADATAAHAEQLREVTARFEASLAEMRRQHEREMAALRVAMAESRPAPASPMPFNLSFPGAQLHMPAGTTMQLAADKVQVDGAEKVADAIGKVAAATEGLARAVTEKDAIVNVPPAEVTARVEIAPRPKPTFVIEELPGGKTKITGG